MKPRLTLPRDDNHTGRDLGEEEIGLLTQAIKSGCLTSTRGTMVKALEESFARKHNMKHCVAASSGTAALHTAIAALDHEPGDEIVTTPITDMGAIAPMLYQGAIPIFADVDPDTYNVTAATIAPRITQHTRAIMVTHLFGNPCDMEPIMALAVRHGLPVIEDCSQAFLSEYRGRRVGTMGRIGCFSLQQGKHMTCGEGGLAITDDPALAAAPPLRQQGLGLRRHEPGSLLPRAELPDDGAARGGGSGSAGQARQRRGPPAPGSRGADEPAFRIARA
jgi:dTDP-4-amino-4,6-dideoxygalactose transaminase